MPYQERHTGIYINGLCLFLDKSDRFIYFRHVSMDNIAYISLGASALLMILRLLKPADAFFKAINWDVLGIY